MTDNYQPDWSSLPPEIVAILQKSPDSYTQNDNITLTRFLVFHGQGLDPTLASIIGETIKATATAPPMGTGPGGIFLPAQSTANQGPLAGTSTPPTPQVTQPQVPSPVGDTGFPMGQAPNDRGTTIPSPPSTDWRQQASNQGLQVQGGTGPDPFGNLSDWWNARDHSQQASLSGAPGPYTIPPSPPGVSPSLPPTPFTGSGPGLPSVPQREEFGRLLGRNTRRADRAQERGDLAPEDWKKLAFSMDPNSAFAGLAPGMASLYTQDPTLAALQMYGPDTAIAGQMTPQVSGALELAQMGALGGHGKGLGSGPSSAAGQLRLAEEMMQGLGPGDYIDPRLAYKKAFRMTQRTPGEEMYAGHSGTQGDIQNQIEVTNSALANAAGPWMTEGGIQGLANQLNRAAQDWLQKKSVGQMDMTYPEYLKSIGAQRWVSPGIV